MLWLAIIDIIFNDILSWIDVNGFYTADTKVYIGYSEVKRPSV